jgi:TonB family protein
MQKPSIFASISCSAVLLGSASLCAVSMVAIAQDTSGVQSASAQHPADSESLPKRVLVSSRIAQALHKDQPEPAYPAIAVLAHVSGTVVLQAVIGTDGHVLSLHVVSGPAMLQQATIDAVGKWVYKPYLMNNEPVEVSTTIKVVFPLINVLMSPPLAGHPHAVP